MLRVIRLRLISWLGIGIAFITSTTAALAQSIPGSSTYSTTLQQISFALGVPATLLGAAYSWVLISKTRAETAKAAIDTEKAGHEIAKLRLERQKLEREVAGSDQASKSADINAVSISDRTSDLLLTMNERSFRNQQATSLILRSIVLGLFQSFASLFLNPTVMIGSVFVNYLRRNMSMGIGILSEFIFIIPSIIVFAIQALIFVVVGLPLIKDLNIFLGIDMPKLRFWRRK